MTPQSIAAVHEDPAYLITHLKNRSIDFPSVGGTLCFSLMKIVRLFVP